MKFPYGYVGWKILRERLVGLFLGLNVAAFLIYAWDDLPQNFHIQRVKFVAWTDRIMDKLCRKR